jgi:hypothetical protein
MLTPVVLVGGLHADARTAAVDRLLVDHPGAVAIHHDIRAVTCGHVLRVVRDSAGVLDVTSVAANGMGSEMPLDSMSR